MSQVRGALRKTASDGSIGGIFAGIWEGMPVPHEQMSEQQVAAYLRLDVRDVTKRASRGRIPCRRVGGKHVFVKAEVDQWVWREMHTFAGEALAGIERGVSEHHGMEANQPIICPLLSERAVAVPLAAKTRDAVIRGLIDLGVEAELIFDRDRILEELRGRETLCSTALLPGVAFPHPRQPLPYDIAESFIAVGLTPGGIPFGAEDGSLTRLFFLVCCKDERTHLHVLARLVRMLDDRGVVNRLLETDSPQGLEELLAHREMEILHGA
jgi:PTS system nitrogen regulatory IIA component